MNVYDFNVYDSEGNSVALNKYRGKVTLIVNTATKCGLKKQYEGLQKLYNQYRARGLRILAFPCNQFGKQELDDDNQIVHTCQINHGVDFPIFKKVEVNGEEADPLFKYLAHMTPGICGEAIKWNFTKFLVDKDGVVVARFAPLTKPEKIEKYIKKLL